MFISKKLSQKIEMTISKSHLSYTKTCQKFKGDNSSYQKFGSGYSFFSQVVGWGFGENDIDHLEDIENFYCQHKMNKCAIELSPFTGESMALKLTSSGYLVSHWRESVNDVS